MSADSKPITGNAELAPWDMLMLDRERKNHKYTLYNIASGLKRTDRLELARIYARWAALLIESAQAMPGDKVVFLGDEVCKAASAGDISAVDRLVHSPVEIRKARPLN